MTPNKSEAPKSDPELLQRVADAPYSRAFLGSNTEPGPVLVFYNPGPRFRDMLSFDTPFFVPRDRGREVLVGKQPVEAPERGFFEVPTTMTIQSGEDGSEQTATIGSLYARVMSQYRSRGVVLIESPVHKSRVGDQSVAPTQAEAMRLGDALYREYIKGLVNEWIRIVEDTRAGGGVPMAATGMYKTALATLNMADPADRVETLEHERKGVASQRESQSEVARLEAMVNKLMGQVATLSGAKA